MTLDEAIEHYERNANQLDGTIWEDIADDSRQLADWLTDLRMYRESEPREKVVARITLSEDHVNRIKQELEDEFLEMARTLNAENAKLRELVADYERCSMHAGCDTCEHDGKMSVHCPLSPCFPDTDELHELGVEVDR